MEQDRKVLQYGTRVRCTFVDMHGFCGRELHPSPGDVGFEGVVIGNTASFMDEDGCLIERLEDADPGAPLGANDYAVYLVLGNTGRKLELVDHEVTAR